MKKLTALSVLMLAVACATAQTAAQPSSAKKQNDEARGIACAPQGKANTLSAARGWGATLLNEGVSSRNPRAARAQRQLAADCYHLALKIAPNDANAIEGLATIWGLEAAELASTDLPAARVLWALAYDKFALALQLDPKFDQAARRWGVALGAQARALAAARPADLAGARALWAQAGEKYALGLQISPDDAAMASNWGTLLGHEANAVASSDLPAARALWQQAYDRYALAMKLDPQNIIPASNLAAEMTFERTALLKASPAPSAQTIAQADDLLQRARKILLGLADDSKATVAYNIACIYAIDGQVADAMQWLQRSNSAGSLPAKSHIAQDSDLDAIRNTPAFAAWFAQLQ
jgi:hypothetical protein